MKYSDPFEFQVSKQQERRLLELARTIAVIFTLEYGPPVLVSLLETTNQLFIKCSLFVP